MAKVSVLLPSYNAESTVSKALESVKWADEIFVVDSFSTDRTVEICREYTDKIVLHEYINSAKQKNWAIPQLSCEWVLQVDTDEYLESDLIEEIKWILRNPPAGFDGFKIPRRNHMFGEWTRGANLHPDYQLRLFRRDVGRFEDREVHAHITVPGKVGVLKHHINHHGFEEIAWNLVKFERYMRYELAQLKKRGMSFRWVHVTLRPIAMFLWAFLLKKGFLYGFRGFFWSVWIGYYNFMMYAKLWEDEWKQGKRR